MPGIHRDERSKLKHAKSVIGPSVLKLGFRDTDFYLEAMMRELPRRIVIQPLSKTGESQSCGP
jgi:hypothetical protein